MDRLAAEYSGAAPTAIQVLSFSFVAAQAIEAIGHYVLQRSQRLATREYDRIILAELHVPLYITIFLVGVYASTQLLPDLGIGFYTAATAMSIILILSVTVSSANSILRLDALVLENAVQREACVL